MEEGGLPWLLASAHSVCVVWTYGPSAGAGLPGVEPPVTRVWCARSTRCSQDADVGIDVPSDAPCGVRLGFSSVGAEEGSRAGVLVHHGFPTVSLFRLAPPSCELSLIECP